MNSIKIRDFSLKYTLESGQFFHWERRGGIYYIVSDGRLFKIFQDQNKLFFEGVSSDYLEHFLALDFNIRKICASFPAGKFLDKAVERYWGLRILRQEPWECTMAFILSSISSIKNITKDLKSICTRYGERLSLDGFTGFAVPPAGFKTSEKELRKMKVGFRSEYIEKASKLCREGFFESIKNSKYDVAREVLMSIPGVGPKIAGCVLLFAYGFLDSFPVDTWIRKVMIRLYRQNKLSDSQIADFGRNYFGQYAGYAQQYLFMWSRENKQIFE